MALVNTSVVIDLEVEAFTGRVDPSTLTLQITTPGAVVNTYTYGTDVEIVRTNVGLYEFLLVLSSVGTYQYLWTTTGNVNDTISGTVLVKYPPRDVTFHAVTAIGATPVEDVTLEVRQAGSVITSGSSDVSGDLNLALEAGVYTVVATKPGWSFTAASVTVVGTQPPGLEEFTLTGSDLSLGSATVATCLLYGFAWIGARPSSDHRVLVSIRPGIVAGGPSPLYRDVTLSEQPINLIPAQNGRWELSVPVGSTVTVAERGRRSKTIIVPNAVTLDIANSRSVVTEESA